MVITGTIIKGYSGFYYVWDGKNTWECSLRGKFRVKKQTFLVGDQVDITVINPEQKKAVIEKVHERKTELTRPSIANIKQVILVIALKDPDPDFWLLDRLLILAEHKQIKPLLCFNKVDLISSEGEEKVVKSYAKTNFPILLTSSKTKRGLDELKKALENKISVMAGPSGVGKSSLVNALEPGLTLKTGDLSEKLGRGKHTTRHVELIRLSCEGLLADTPGFSQIYLPDDLKREDLLKYYPEFFEFNSKCKFKTCLHRDEPQCAVREAALSGVLDYDRYQRYLVILEEVIKEERRY